MDRFSRKQNRDRDRRHTRHRLRHRRALLEAGASVAIVRTYSSRVLLRQ